jgi:polysaccharide export outer membrane protein
MIRNHCFPSASRFARCAALLCLTALLTLAAQAQFAGPAPGRSDSPPPLPPVSTPAQIAAAPVPAPVLRLHPGDLIEVTLYGVHDYDSKVRIDANGNADLPLVGPVHLEGLTLQQAQVKIGDTLDAAGMIRNPDVTITVLDSTQDIITVSGEVNSPKTIPAFGAMHLLDAITAAGGLTRSASHAISILRPGAPEPLLVQLGPDLMQASTENILVYPGDQIIVPRTGVVYVVGAVKAQSAYPLANGTPLTLMQAVTLAGGVNFDAANSKTRIIRTIGTKREEIPIDMHKVMFGKVPDPVLQNDDIVFVPTNSFKAGLKGGAAGVALGLLYAIPLLP